ncbi:hypothetical protein [Rhizobium sp. S163]|uniref:hypothetical protein n=1 Tax=Rhizobium sp. S163 TaxID=3055039 RepID=UPI0025A9C438|nr:hypothetical protein [Rhizobium sp. S163]MDM9648699.1 hypothetical protein [Rhizobium sp. S163]
MDDSSKTLTEMSARERSEIVANVVEALENTSANAEESGDSRLLANAHSIACTLRGCRLHFGELDLVAAEQLLTQGITLMSMLSAKRSLNETKH